MARPKKDEKDKWTTFFITIDARDQLRDTKIKIWSREALTISDKVVDLVYLYKKLLKIWEDPKYKELVEEVLRWY